jgi:hypothetical protein
MTKTKRIDTKRGRFYEVTGQKWPSVTTILSVLGKDALIGWAAKQEREFVFEAARQVYTELVDGQERDTPMPVLDEFDLKLADRLNVVKAHTKLLKEASAIGTNVHARIEFELNVEMGLEPEGEPKLASDSAIRAYGHYQDWRDTVELKPLHSELAVWSTVFGYAGTIDLIAEVTIEGERKVAVIDFKTGKRIYREALLQNAAYRLAAKERGIPNDLGLIVRLPKEPTDPAFEVGVVPPLEDLAGVFLALIPVHRWLNAEKEKAS